MASKINDNKTIRDESIKDLLNNLLIADIDNLSPLQKIMITEVLINGRTFAELKETINLPTSRQKIILKSAVINLNNALNSLKTKLKAYHSLKTDLHNAEELIKDLGGKIKKNESISPELKKLLSLPIDKIGLSVRVKNSCAWGGIKDVEDLVRFSKREFLALRNAGKTSVKEVEDFFNKKGLSWSMDV